MTKENKTEYIIGDLEILDITHYNVAATFADRDSMNKFFSNAEKIFLFRYQGILYSLGDESTVFRIEERIFDE